MKRPTFLSLLICIFIFLPISHVMSIPDEKKKQNETTEVSDKEKLVVVWTSGDKEVAMKMVFMYTYNAKKYNWWKDITLLVWGPSSKLLSEDKELQDYVKNMLDEDINVLACKACADMYEVSDDLEKIGVTVKYTGTDLTEFIKERHVITF